VDQTHNARVDRGKAYTERMVKKRRSKNPKSAIRNPKSLVAVIMGSKSDWDTMRATSETLARFGVAHESRVISAHRTPALASEFASTAESRGIEVIIAAAGGAAHLAGVIAAHTTLPVLGVPMKSDALNGLDSLLSTVQMPAGIPVGTLAIGKAGATNAALFAIAILANSRTELKRKLSDFRAEQAERIRETKLD
jgi:5-(carboxyamino)imidazole ribonucleotide mutase